MIRQTKRQLLSNRRWMAPVSGGAAVLGQAAAAEVDVHPGASHVAGGVEEQRIVHTLHVAVHQCDH